MTGFGYDPTHSIVKARQEGLQTVLYKPFRADRLMEAVEQALRPPAPAADSRPRAGRRPTPPEPCCSTDARRPLPREDPARCSLHRPDPRRRRSWGISPARPGDQRRPRPRRPLAGLRPRRDARHGRVGASGRSPSAWALLATDRQPLAGARAGIYAVVCLAVACRRPARRDDRLATAPQADRRASRAESAEIDLAATGRGRRRPDRRGSSCRAPALAGQRVLAAAGRSWTCERRACRRPWRA